MFNKYLNYFPKQFTNWQPLTYEIHNAEQIFKVLLYTNLFGILNDVSKEMIWWAFMLENTNIFIIRRIRDTQLYQRQKLHVNGKWELLCCRAVPDERWSRSGSWSCRFQSAASQNWHDPLPVHPTWSAPEIPPTKSSAGLYTSVLTYKSLNPSCKIITCLLYLPLLSVH